MKQYVLVAFSIIVLCGLSLPIALVNAVYEGYETINYQAIEAPVEDGAWTTEDEWNDAMTPPNLPTTFHWRQKWTWPSNIIEHFLIEFFTDNTNDAGDYFQLCVDNMADGGTTPQSDDIRIDWMGHDVSGLTIYQGNGTGWEVFTDFTWNVDIYITDSIGASPLESNPHWIIELQMDRSKSEFDVSGAGYQPGIRLAVYDESNSEAGVQAWPPTSRDVPNDWGLETGTTDNIPEPMTIVTVVLLSSVAIVVSSHFLRRRPKTENPSAVKTG
ncbi:MAG: hypothetical protein OEZ25_03390 [Candidatus Bathyarchaeota archaeon]|nr:hypothetical protein [Candidatus Bathyarchaeota archaeon]